MLHVEDFNRDFDAPAIVGRDRRFGFAGARLDVADNGLAVYGVATTRARNQHDVHAAHDNRIVAQTHEPLDGLHAAAKFRLFAFFEFGKLFGAEEFGDHIARHDLAVADGGEQIVHAPETVIVGDAFEVAV